MKKEKDLPFVTVGIIVKNEEMHIEDTINSILDSTYSKGSYRVLVVDGNSTDRTQAIIKKLIKKNKNIRLIVEPWKKGTHGKARNLVLDNAEGKYVAFTDGDCIVDKNWLNNLVKSIEKERELDSKVVAVGGVRKPIETKDWKEKVLNNLMGTLFGSGGSNCFIETKKKYVDSIPNYNAIYLRETVVKERYSELGVGEDYEFGLRLNREGYKIVFNKDPIIYHHQEPNFANFFKQMYSYGKAQINVYRKIGKIRFFAIIAPLFVLGLIGGFIFGMFNQLMLDIYLGVILVYLTLVFFNSIKIVFNTKKLYNFATMFLYPLEHIFYGVGVLGGIWNAIKK